MKFLKIFAAFFAVLMILCACGNVAPRQPYEEDDFTLPFDAETGSVTREEKVTETVPETSSEEREALIITEPEGTADISETIITTTEPEITTEPETEPIYDDLPVEGEYYYDLENVVLYLELYGELPPNYITKKEARDLGWSGGSVEDYLEGAAIGGDHFGNYEGQLPDGDYSECDIDTDGYYSRGSRRLIYSDDGRYYYSGDHYETFREVRVAENYEIEIEE